MVARTAPWLSHACFASGHFTISALSWPLKLKHCMGGGKGWSRGCNQPPQPEPHTFPSHPPSAAPFYPKGPSPLCTLMPMYPPTPPAPPPHSTALPAIPIHAPPRTSPQTLAQVPLHPGVSGGDRPLPALPHLAEEGDPAAGTAPAHGSGQRRGRRLGGRPVAPLADVGQRRQALLVPPVLCGEGQPRRDPHVAAGSGCLSPPAWPGPAPHLCWPSCTRTSCPWRWAGACPAPRRRS